MIGYTRITKEEFYRLGGFANTRCVRVQRGRSWAYFFYSGKRKSIGSLSGEIEGSPTT